jgi:plastocyanin
MRTLHVRSLLSALAVVLSLVVVPLACGSDPPSAPTEEPNPGPAPTPADVTITIVGMSGSQSYSPNPGTVRAGQTVAWRNADSVVHTATADGGSFNTGNIAPGATSAPIRVSTIGSFAYHCVQHPTMVGTLQVQQ